MVINALLWFYRITVILTVCLMVVPRLSVPTEKFSEHVPKSPIRELLELEPETAKFR